MVIGAHIINRGDELNVRVSVNLGITLPVAYGTETKWLKPNVGIELDVPSGAEPEEFMDSLEQLVLGKLSEYLEQMDKWSAG